MPLSLSRKNDNGMSFDTPLSHFHFCLKSDFDFESESQRLIDIYPLENRDRFFREPNGIEDVVVQDRFEKIVLVVRLERRLTGHHLVHEHAERPPVDGGAVRQLLQDLRGDVVGRAAERVGRHAVGDALLAHAKVGDFTVALAVQQDVVQFQIPEARVRFSSKLTETKFQ